MLNEAWLRRMYQALKFFLDQLTSRTPLAPTYCFLGVLVLVGNIRIDSGPVCLNTHLIQLLTRTTSSVCSPCWICTMKLLHAIIACVLLGITAGAAPNSNTPANDQVLWVASVPFDRECRFNYLIIPGGRDHRVSVTYLWVNDVTNCFVGTNRSVRHFCCLDV